MNGKNYREELIELVKSSGQEVINRAEDLVGTGDLICDFDICLRFPKDGIPTIEVNKSYISKESAKVLYPTIK